MSDILVLGVGNILLSDEAIGVRVVEALQQHYDFSDGVEFLDGGTAGMELFEHLRHRKSLIVVDAIRSPGSPGDMVVLRDKDVPLFFNNRISPHQLGLSDVLLALEFVDQQPEHITLFGIVPESLKPEIKLSDLIAAKLPELVAKVRQELEALGVQSSRKHTSMEA